MCVLCDYVAIGRSICALVLVYEVSSSEDLGLHVSISLQFDSSIIYIKAIWVIDQVGLQVGLRALNDRGRMNFMWKSQLKP